VANAEVVVNEEKEPAETAVAVSEISLENAETIKEKAVETVVADTAVAVEAIDRFFLLLF
jgi:hypothetical protein